MSTALMRNDVFEQDKRKYRLVHVVAANDAAYVVPMDDPQPDPRRWSLKELAAMAADPKKLRVLKESEVGTVTRPNTASAADVAVRDLRSGRIKGIVDKPEIWEPATRVELLKNHAKDIGVSTKTLLKNLRQWWVGGQTDDALLGNHFKSGRIEESTPGNLTVTEKSPNGPVTVIFAPAKNKARGRKPNEGGYDPLAMPPELRLSVLNVARKHFEEDACKSVRGACTVVLSELFSLHDETGKPLRDSNGAAVLKEPGQRPSVGQIRYLLNKALVDSSTRKNRYGIPDYENNHAPSTGSVLDDCLGPGDIYEIDATFIDNYDVAKTNRSCIIGKPTLFLVIDRWSRLIVGFYISLENPSWAEATQAILSISGDWEALCKRLGVEYDPRDWPGRGVMPNRFVGDRADMITNASNALCDGIGTQVTNCPALASKDKAIVESGFLTTHAPLRQHAPGYEPPTNPFKRRAKKYHRDAALTLDEMAAVFLRIVIAHNRKEKLGYQASPEEITQNLRCTPRDIWSRGVAQRMGCLARMPIDLLRRKLMPRSGATVEVDGIHFKGLIYKLDGLGEWCTRASLRGVFEVSVAYTTNLVDKIIVQDPHDKCKEHIVGLTTTSEEYSGYSFAEVLYVQQLKAKKDRAALRFNEGHDVALLQDMTGITQPAVAQMKVAAKGMTPGQRLAGGDEVRATEAQERRKGIHDMENPGLHYGALGADSDVKPELVASDATVGAPEVTASAEPKTAATVQSQVPAPAPVSPPPAATVLAPVLPPTQPACGDTDPDLEAALNKLME